jgi:uncharacterized protein
VIAPGCGARKTRQNSSTAVSAGPQLDENIAAARFANLLYRYTNDKTYRAMAENAMKYLSTPEVARQRRILVAGILLADRELQSDPVHITVLGSKKDAAAQALFKKANSYPTTYKVVEWYDKTEGPLASTGDLIFPELPVAAAFGCANGRCSLPIRKPENIAKTIDSFSKGN